MENNDENQLYEELKGFLKSDRPDLRLAATEAVLHEVRGGNASKLVRRGGGGDGEGFIRILAKNVGYYYEEDEDDGSKAAASAASAAAQEVSLNSLKALVSLTSRGTTANQCTEDLLDAGGVNRMVEVVLQPVPRRSKSNSNASSSSTSFRRWRQRVNYSMALLANMTRTERGAVEFVGKTLPDRAVPVVASSDGGGDDDDKTRPTVGGVGVGVRPTMELLLARFLEPPETYHGEDTRDQVKDVDYDRLLSDANEEAEEAEEEAAADDENDGNPDDPSGPAATATGNTTTATTTTTALDGNDTDPFQHFAAVLMNSTQVEAGRNFILRHRRDDDEHNDAADDAPPGTTATKTTTVLQKLLPQLRRSNPIRRRGAAGTIRNCCLQDANSIAWWLLNVVNITVHLLYPLAGPEELSVEEKQGLHPDLWLEGPDKRREIDVYARRYLVDTVLLLCTSGRRSREKLRLDRAYVVLKWADMVEEDEVVSERIDDCVQFLRRDEHGTEEGSSDKLVRDAYRKLSVPAGAAVTTTTTTEQQPSSSAAAPPLDGGKSANGDGDVREKDNNYDDVD